MENRRTSRWFFAFAWILALVGFGLLAVSAYFGPGHLSILIAILILATVISENAAISLPGGGSMSIVYPISIAAALLFGPLGAGIVVLCAATNIQELREKRPLTAIFGNAGQLLTSLLLPAWAYVSLGGWTFLSDGQGNPLSAADIPEAFVPLAVLGMGAYLLNVGLVSVGIGLLHQVSPFQIRRAEVVWTAPYYMAMSVLGVTIAQVMAVNPAAFVFLVFPMVVAREVYRDYLRYTRLYFGTVRTLVAALEAKDPYTRGHSERVARYAATIARAAGLSEERVERLRMAAQLHDLGKVAINSELLMKASSLDASEFEMVRAHPESGASIAAGVPNLGVLAEIVRYHHERYDGAGYPAGLAGEQIPLESRILAIADSYDAMTTARAYRGNISHEDAIAEVITCSGTQFDPELAKHFVESMQGDRHEG